MISDACDMSVFLSFKSMFLILAICMKTMYEITEIKKNTLSYVVSFLPPHLCGDSDVK